MEEIMDVLLLKSKMTLNGDTQSTLAKALEIAEKTLSEKMNGKSQFNHSEIRTIVFRYKLTPEDIKKIFFS